MLRENGTFGIVPVCLALLAVDAVAGASTNVLVVAVVIGWSLGMFKRVVAMTGRCSVGWTFIAVRMGVEVEIEDSTLCAAVEVVAVVAVLLPVDP